MRTFKCLLRGFKDLSDGSNTAVLDIPDSHIPDNPKEFRQKWGYFIVEEDFKNLGVQGVTEIEEVKRLSDEIVARQLKINDIIHKID